MLVKGLRQWEIKLGVMQGRLTPSRGRGIQFFPFEEWEGEFSLAAQLGLDEIEFIFDLERWEENPLLLFRGQRRIKELIFQSGVAVNYICADFFMKQPPFLKDGALRDENAYILGKLISAAQKIGARSIEIPLLDNSSLRDASEEEKLLLVEWLRFFGSWGRECGITLSLETDLPPQELLMFMQRLNHPAIDVTYDSGNSAALGYDSYQEVTTLGHYLSNVHIKDRMRGGGTVPLGRGSADFDRLFQGLKEIRYRGSLILQAARGQDGEEQKTIREYIRFVGEYLQQY